MTSKSVCPVCHPDWNVTTLVGYTILYVQPNPHGKETIAVEGLVFVGQSYRGHGAQLIREADALLAAEGINRVFRTVCLTAERDHGPMLARMGYAPKHQEWCRKLNPAAVARPQTVVQDAPDFHADRASDRSTAWQVSLPTCDICGVPSGRQFCPNHTAEEVEAEMEAQASRAESEAAS